MEKEIVWTETALNQLEEIYFYILEHSLSYTISDKVIDQIFVATSVLKKNWDIYEIDEMKLPNDNNYRAFEIHSYRISYKITNESIYIIRVRHTSRSPKNIE
jgi:plasmid stabilization system protein ParE